jgi:ATP adenylyltransferase
MEVNFDRLWAPWRLEYVMGGEPDNSIPPEPIEWQPDAHPICFLCRAAARYTPGENADRRLLLVDNAAHSTVVVNRFPYNNGHLLISPKRHVGDLSLLTAAEHADCMQHLAKFVSVYRKLINAEGFNIGLNLGKVAGAGLPGHLHWHLVPRWSGDNNFMPVLAGTRVIPQSLDALWEILTDAVASK